MMQVVCAWCGWFIRHCEGYGVSHGMCEHCFNAEMEAQRRLEPQSWFEVDVGEAGA